MSTFDPFLPLTSPGCPCGMHRSQAEHNHSMQLQLRARFQLVTPENQDKFRQTEAVVAGAVLRQVFPGE
jgi:hypothetical protein